MVIERVIIIDRHSKYSEKADLLTRISGDESVTLISGTSESLPQVRSARIEGSLQNRNDEETQGIKLSLTLGFVRHGPTSPLFDWKIT